ncbi:MAG: HAD family hydrolase [Armatimonadetes bacterium]|nr:HAD family hydrolase [Armatimonadota bacterium]
MPNYLEVLHPDHPRGGFRFALFDFDGTISLIRQGWQGVMIPMMVEVLLDTNSGEPVAALESCARDYVERLTGKQTIYQMIQLKEEVEKRGGTALDPLEYKRIYHDRLWKRIEHRVAGLKEGKIDRRDMTVPGSEGLLMALRKREVSLFLASGTDLCYVQDECSALGLSGYFDGGIHGALDDYRSFSKKIIIERIYQENDLHGSELVAFGDGYVEIENTREVGGVAVGVATDEIGLVDVDPWKRTRLIQAGADVIIPHFRNHQELVSYLFIEE